MPIKLHCKSVLCGLISPTSAPLYNLQLGRGYIGDDSLEATVTNAIVQDPPRPRSRFSLPSLSLSISISPLPPFLSIRRPPPYVQNFPPRGGEDLSSRCVGSRSSPRVWKGLENLVCSRETTIVHPRLRKWVIIGSCLWRLRHGNCLCIKQIPDRYSAVGWADQIVRVCRGYPQNSIAIMTPDRSIEFRVFSIRSSYVCIAEEKNLCFCFLKETAWINRFERDDGLCYLICVNRTRLRKKRKRYFQY